MQLPESIHPDQLRDDTEYMVIIHPNTGELSFVGPFRPLTSLLPIACNYPLTGNFRVRGFFSEDNTESMTLIPKDGRSVIYRIVFSLHLYSPDIKELIESTLRTKNNWMQTVRGPNR